MLRGVELPTKSTGTLCLHQRHSLDPVFVPSAIFANFGGGDSLLLFLTPFSLPLPDPGLDDYLKSKEKKKFLSFKNIAQDKINSRERSPEKPLQFFQTRGLV